MQLKLAVEMLFYRELADVGVQLQFVSMFILTVTKC